MEEMGPPGGGKKHCGTNWWRGGGVGDEGGGGGVGERGSGLHEVMASRCFGIIAGKNSIPAVVIYHVRQLTALKGRQIDRQET